MKGKDNEVTLELVARTTFELKRLDKYKHKNELELVRIAYDFLDFCRSEMANAKARRERVELMNQWLETNPVKLSQAVDTVVGKNGSHNSEVFAEFLQSAYREFSSDFLEEKKIPSGFLSEMKEKFPKWNAYKKKLSAKKNALIGRYPEKKDLIEPAQSISELRSIILQIRSQTEPQEG
jgi:hypothetical protein